MNPQDQGDDVHALDALEQVSDADEVESQRVGEAEEDEGEDLLDENMGQ